MKHKSHYRHVYTPKELEFLVIEEESEIDNYPSPRPLVPSRSKSGSPSQEFGLGGGYLEGGQNGY